MTVRAVSSADGLRSTMPRCAPRPDATKSATGVASPKAQGQAITNTATAISIDLAMDSPLVNRQKIKVAIESNVTAGTNTAEIRSASL